MTVRFGLVIVGDEILSGKRQDKHFEQVRKIMGERGLVLSWVSYLGDDRDHCVSFFRQSFQSSDVVFSCGGIGATPDDHTRQAVAEALGLPLVLHPEAERLITERTQEMNQPVTDGRLRMGEFPQGAEIIPNPYNKIPGFRMGQHHFLPGFPIMAWPMMAWVLDQYYSAHFRSHAEEDRSLMVRGLFEAMVTPLLEALTADFPMLKIYSLPAAPVPGDTGAARLLELGVKSTGLDQTSALDQAYGRLRAGVLELGGKIESEQTVQR